MVISIAWRFSKHHHNHHLHPHPQTMVIQTTKNDTKNDNTHYPSWWCFATDSFALYFKIHFQNGMICHQWTDHSQTPEIATSNLNHMNFPIRSRVLVTLSHLKHANTTGVITRYTAKFITFAPDHCPQHSIHILPELLTILSSSPAIVPPIFSNSSANWDHTALPIKDDIDDNTQAHG